MRWTFSARWVQQSRRSSISIEFWVLLTQCASCSGGWGRNCTTRTLFNKIPVARREIRDKVCLLNIPSAPRTLSSGHWLHATWNNRSAFDANHNPLCNRRKQKKRNTDAITENNNIRHHLCSLTESSVLSICYLLTQMAALQQYSRIVKVCGSGPESTTTVII